MRVFAHAHIRIRCTYELHMQNTYCAYVLHACTCACVHELHVTTPRLQLRAVYLKYGSGALYPADVDGQHCLGRCTMTWYVSFDRYNGERRYSSANTTVVPSGGEVEDMRSAGDWFISV